MGTQSENTRNRSERVLVAMSGGVDSSVSAALLIEQGYDVEGAFIVTWQAPWLPCTWREERRDAMRVAARLGIPLHTIDLSKEYERDVVDYLVREYKSGRTPNPDVMCNKHIKFGAFLTQAIERGFDKIATGHYARVEIEEGEGGTLRYLLYTGTDRMKDQSYFLWTLGQEELSRTLFPVGGHEKKDVRELARQYGLSTADKKDSQGVCFLGKVDMKEFLSHYIQAEPGDVFDIDGRVVGKHDGAVFYTIGQRHGFSVQARDPFAEPLYVVAKDMEHNALVVASAEPTDLAIAPSATAIELSGVHWVAGEAPLRIQTDMPICARLRYRQPLFPVIITEITNTHATVTPEAPQRFAPAGQSMVLYMGETCLGGGIIT
jgi:tRNA-uridine 2-sulfurtransferase